MRAKISASCLIAVLLVVSCASATVVTVTPENMQGWSIETNQGARASFANYGYAVAQRPVGESPTAPGPWTADDGAYTNLGQGAYYATLINQGYSTAWLGLDTSHGQSLAGIALNRITKLEYYALVAHFPIHIGGGGTDWKIYTSWGYPRQPIQLQITAQSPDGTDRKQFWFLPWEPRGWAPGYGSFLRGDNCGQNTNKWIRYDCIDRNNTEPAHWVLQSYWYCPDPQQAFETWADLIALFGNYTLVPTSNDPYPTGWKSAGWDATTDPVGTPLCTGTGKCINFEVGARKSDPTAVYSEEPTGWCTDFQQFRGYVDRFTLGIDSTDVTYDFEPSAGAAPPRIVCMSHKAAYDPIVNTLPGSDQPGKVMVKIIGKVAARENPRFWMGDPFTGTIDPLAPQIVTYTFEGDPRTTTTWPNPTYIDEYWSVTGILERSRIQQIGVADNIWPMWTRLANMEFFY